MVANDYLKMKTFYVVKDINRVKRQEQQEVLQVVYSEVCIS